MQGRAFPTRSSRVLLRIRAGGWDYLEVVTGWFGKEISTGRFAGVDGCQSNGYPGRGRFEILFGVICACARMFARVMAAPVMAASETQKFLIEDFHFGFPLHQRQDSKEVLCPPSSNWSGRAGRPKKVKRALLRSKALRSVVACVSVSTLTPPRSRIPLCARWPVFA